MNMFRPGAGSISRYRVPCFGIASAFTTCTSRLNRAKMLFWLGVTTP